MTDFGITSTGSTSYPTTDIGNKSTTTQDSGNVNYEITAPITPSASITVSQISVYTSQTSGHVAGAIYNTSSDAPTGAPIVHNDTKTVSGAGATGWFTDSTHIQAVASGAGLDYLLASCDTAYAVKTLQCKLL